MGPVNPETGWVIDFDDLLNAWRPLGERLDHYYLNDVEGLENPTSEILAGWVWQRLQNVLPGLAQVTIFETCEVRCVYEGT